MIHIARVILHSRSARSALMATFVMWGLAAVTGRRSLEIDLSDRFPATKLAVVELCAILTATVLAILTQPRFWEWDRISHCARRPRLVAAATAAAGIVLSALCVLAVVPLLPPYTSWTWVLANALLMSATVYLVAPLLSPLVGGAIALVAWFGCGLVTNLDPSVWLPVGTYRQPEGHWTMVILVVVAAFALHARTCGKTAWAYRQFNKDQ